MTSPRPILKPVPPSSASVDGSGELKDTPANRALHPTVTSQRLFKGKKLTEGAVYADAGLRIQTKVPLPGGGTKNVGGYWTTPGRLVTFWD